MSDTRLTRPSPCHTESYLMLDHGSPGCWEEPPEPARVYCVACGVDFEPTDEDYREVYEEIEVPPGEDGF